MRLFHFAYLTGMAAVLAFAAGRATAQAPVNAKTSGSAKSWTAPRAADGHPDLQGVWANNTATPLERPASLAGRATLTDQEVAALKKKAAEIFDGKGDAEFGDTIFEKVLDAVQGKLKAEPGKYKKAENGFDGGTGDYSSVWLVGRDWDNRTSLITDPPDGKMPPMTAEGQKRQVALFAAMTKPPSGPEDRALSERCITFGSPRLLAGYNSYYQIFQTKDTVVIESETIHDARVIPLDGRPHPPATVQQWLGDSRGHWEGDTLVVDTTNYKPEAFMNATEKLHVIERFTRSGPETLKYEITIDDPATWTKPWSLMIPLRHTNEAMFEYACHEGNYGMAGILSGARAQEKAAQSGKTTE